MGHVREQCCVHQQSSWITKFLEGLLKSLFAKEALKFPVGLDLGTVSRLSFTASINPCWKAQGWETIAKAFLHTSGSCRTVSNSRHREKMKVPLWSRSFQHPFSQSRRSAHLVAGSQLQQPTTPGEEKIFCQSISLYFFYLCRLKGRCEGKQKLEVVFFQFNQHEQPLLLLFKGGTLTLWNLVRGLLMSKGIGR